MRTEYYIQAGQVITYTKDKPANGLFNLSKFFKKMLVRFNIAFVDDCCTGVASPDGTDETFLPMRYNKTTSKIQYYNDTNKTWTNLSSF